MERRVGHAAYNYGGNGQMGPFQVKKSFQTFQTFQSSFTGFSEMCQTFGSRKDGKHERDNVGTAN